jgi:NAD(P)-dependent dehydrogenase (short-subunit alcohol dehydrogenase family)
LMASRSPERLEAAASEVRSRHSGASVETVGLDLASLRSVRAAAAAILAAHDRLDLLIDNAGVMAIPHAETEDGFEMQFGTNHLGHFALTGLLLPAMLDVAGNRVVAVTSQVRRVGRIDFDDLHGRRRYGRWKAYAQSKLANLLFVEELERRLRAAQAATIAVAAHPGYAATNLQTASTRLQQIAYQIGNAAFAQPARAGALPLLYAAVAPGVSGGELFGPDKMGGTRGSPRRDNIEARALDPQVSRRLWAVSVEQTGVDYALLDRG